MPRFRWGGGVWISYGLTVWWCLDVFAVWFIPGLTQRWPRYERIRRGIFLFLGFNAAVVFAHGPSRLVGIMACTAVLVAWGRHPAQTGPRTGSGRQSVRE